MTLLSTEKLQSLLKLAASVEDIPGVFVELGVYEGGALRQLAELCPERMIYGFDTFQGLPKEDWDPSEPHVPGEFVPRHILAMPRNVQLVPGLFPQSTIGWRLPEPIALAHVDFDFYKGTKAAINWLVPRMALNGVIVFDDYEWQNCPGVKRAIDEAGLVVMKSAPYQATWRASPERLSF